MLADLLSLEKPIITSTAVSLCEYRDDAETWACTITGHVEDPRQFAEEIRALQQHDANGNAINRLHARNAARKYSLEKIAETYRQIYETERIR